MRYTALITPTAPKGGKEPAMFYGHMNARLPLTPTDTLINRLFPYMSSSDELYGAGANAQATPAAEALALEVQAVDHDEDGVRERVADARFADPAVFAAMRDLNADGIDWAVVKQVMRDVAHEIIDEGRQAGCEDYEFQDRAND